MRSNRRAVCQRLKSRGRMWENLAEPQSSSRDRWTTPYPRRSLPEAAGPLPEATQEIANTAARRSIQRAYTAGGLKASQKQIAETEPNAAKLTDTQVGGSEPGT